MAGVGQNGPLAAGMYRLKPYYDTEASIELTDCMYKLPSIYGNNSTRISTPAAGQSTVGAMASVDDLERRQQRILQRLHELQRQVKQLAGEQTATLAATTGQTATLAATTRSCPAAPASLCSKSTCQSAPVTPLVTISDLVITADPARPPLSIFVLARQLAAENRLLTTSFVHSSAQSQPAAQRLARLFQTDGGVVANRNDFKIGITIIWKVEKFSPTLMVDANKQTPIIGEANIARYLARLLSRRYDNDIVTATQIDTLLDAAATLLRGGESASLVKSLASSLAGKSQWLAGENPSLADVVVWSALRQRQAVNALPGNVRQWLERCDKLPEFTAARQFLS